MKEAKKDHTGWWILIITIIVTVLMVVGISLAEKSKLNNNSLQASLLQPAEDNYDFGTISMAQGKATKVFTIKNNTAANITARKLYTSCMCTTARLVTGDKTFGPFTMPGNGYIPEIGETIKPGDETTIEVVFDPAAHGPAGVGPIARKVTLETSDGKVELQFKAQVTP